MGRSIRLQLSKKDIARFERESKGNPFKGESVWVNDDAGPANNADEASNEAQWGFLIFEWNIIKLNEQL